jgi:hypothetical protein
MIVDKLAEEERKGNDAHTCIGRLVIYRIAMLGMENVS